VPRRDYERWIRGAAGQFHPTMFVIAGAWDLYGAWRRSKCQNAPEPSRGGASMGFLSRFFRGEAVPANGPAAAPAAPPPSAVPAAAPAAASQAAPPQPAARVTVGVCSSCGHDLRMKAQAVRPVVRLTCKCGAASEIHVAAGILASPGAVSGPACRVLAGGRRRGRARDPRDRRGAPWGRRLRPDGPCPRRVPPHLQRARSAAEPGDDVERNRRVDGLTYRRYGDV
jgi:hypothetical protein